MLLLEVKRGSQADSLDTAATLMDSLSLKLGEHLVTELNGVTVEGEEGSLAADGFDELRVFDGQSGQFVLEVGASLDGQLSQLVFLDDVVLSGSQSDANRVSHEGVHVAVRRGHPRVLVVIESAREHLLSEGDEVRRLSQVPLLMSPHGASEANASLHLVNDEVDSELLGDVLESLGEFS